MISHRTSNPFSTKFVRAGALPFRFRDGESVELLHDRLTASDWNGQVVGPHGSGKSTLLRTLDHHWNSWNRRAVIYSLHNDERMLREPCWRSWDSRTQVIVDGYEQLSWWSRFVLIYRCRRQQCGLLVTTHSRAAFLPILYQSETSLELARKLVSDLVREPEQLSNDVDRCYANNDGNLRETFMDLYDVCQRA